MTKRRILKMETQTENTNVMTEEQEDRQEYTPLHKSYCRECGTVISAKAISCPKCGATQNQTAENQAAVKQDIASAGLMVLSFFFPLIGLILFCVYSQSTPNAAKEYGKWALIGFVTWIVVSIISVVILNAVMFSAVGSLFNSLF